MNPRGVISGFTSVKGGAKRFAALAKLGMPFGWRRGNFQ